MRLARIMRRPLPIALVVLAAAAIPAPATAAKPHPGSLDKTFGHRASVVFNLPGERMRPRAVAVDRAGRIVVAGHLTASADQYQYPLTFYGRALVVRFRRDGALDTSFGEGGVARIQLPRPVAIDGLQVRPDGALLLSGTALGEEPGERLGAVTRLLPSGALDRAFGSEGLATMSGEGPAFEPPVTAVPHIGVQADGRIVAAGWQRAYDVHASADPFLMRLLPDGAPDTTLDENGTARNGPINPIAVVPYPDGRTVVAGRDEEYFGDTFFTAFTINAGNDNYPCCAPLSALRRYRYNGLTRPLAAQARRDGSLVIAAARDGGLSRPSQLAWIRIGSDGEPIHRGRSPSAEGAQIATFDSRGALLTAGRGSQTAPLILQRYRGPRFQLDRSFGDRSGDVSLYDTGLVPIGLAMQGNKLVYAGYRFSEPAGDQPLTLFRLHARQDISGPIVTIRGLTPRSCLADATDVQIRIRDESRTRTQIRLDRRLLRTTRDKRFRLMIDPAKLAPGRHRLKGDARDAAGNLGRRGTAFRVCAA